MKPVVFLALLFAGCATPRHGRSFGVSGLARGARVEIECIAVAGGGKS